MNEPLGRPAAAVSLAFIVGIAVILSLSPHVGPMSWAIGLAAALAILVGVMKQPGFRRPLR